MCMGNREINFQINKQIKTKINSKEKKKFYFLAIWGRMRKHHLQTQPLCQMCYSNKKIIPAHAVDHIIPFTDRYDELAIDSDNYISLCQSCHSVATQRETKKHYSTFNTYSEWIKYKYEPPRVLGIDGYYL